MQQQASLFPRRSTLMIGAASIAILLAGTAMLWAQYGTAVFFEMVVAGIAWCL
jgi:hypothetical protein